MLERGAKRLVTEMGRLCARLDGLLVLIPPGSTIALLDEPVHRNLGDHLIQRGSQAFFRRYGIRIAYRASTWDYCPRTARKRLPATAILVCQGGGHLGDLYPRHQRLREQILADFPRHRVVVLPQSIHFRDAVAERRARAAFAAHGRLELCLRDRSSFALARDWGCCAVRLLPDMAHALWPIERPVPSTSARTLHLLRRDRARLPVPASLSWPGDARIDWGDLVAPMDTLILALVAAGLRGGRRPGWGAPPRRLLDWEVDRLLERALRVVAPYQSVVSSRLHGALLGLLMAKQVVLLDSLTGKSRAYYETWLSKIPNCQLLDGDG
jgi:pyruvyl transferase EpsO